MRITISVAVLEILRGEIRQSGPFAPHELDVAAVRPGLEAIHGVGQAGTGLGEIGGVDLADVAQADHLAPRPGPGH